MDQNNPIYDFKIDPYSNIVPLMMENIDKIDSTILSILQQDASVSVDRISEQVALSRNACWRRIKRMEEDGIIKSRVALVDAGKVGLGLPVFVLVHAADHSPDWLARFNRAVQLLPEIIGAHRMSGELDYVLRVQVADVADYDRFYKKLIELVPLRDISASFVMEHIKDTTALPV